MALINCTKSHVVFILIIHDNVFGNMHVCGNREGISGLPCSTLKSVDVQCSREREREREKRYNFFFAA